MSGLGRRMDVLEALAEETRLRPYRAFAADLGMPIEELLAEIEDKGVLVNQLLVEGLDVDEIMQRCAAHWNIPLDALRRNCEDRARRLRGRRPDARVDAAHGSPDRRCVAIPELFGAPVGPSI